MRMPLVVALIAAALPAALSAQPWTKVDELPGGFAVELDEASRMETPDGNRTLLRATFRRIMPHTTMESDVALDCAAQTSRILAVRMKEGDKLLTETITQGGEFKPVQQGSSEAIYFKALCGKEPQ